MSKANKKIISLEVRGEYILGSGVSIGAQGSFDSVYLRIKFDETWQGLNKYMTWENAQGETAEQTFITSSDLVDGEPDTYDIPVPQFATLYAGTVRLAISGYVIGGEANQEIESLLNTVSGAFKVLESSAVRLDDSSVNSTLAEQVHNELTRAEDLYGDVMKTLSDSRDAEKKRDEIVGDMNSAIDYILTIQNQLMGGETV